MSPDSVGAGSSAPAGEVARRMGLARSLADVRARLDAACDAAGRPRDDVTLLPVTKFFPASDVAILVDLGCTDVAESREQEASAKVAELGGCAVRWHMIGRVQRNKARNVAAWATSIHSVDTARLVDALDRAATAALDDGVRTAPLEALIQISLDGDPQRGGVLAADLPALADRVAAAPSLRLSGVMAVPPLGSDPDEQFAVLAQLHTRLLGEHPSAVMRSAGMTGDLEAAVRHGSTCVRVGTAIMGARPIASP